MAGRDDDTADRPFTGYAPHAKHDPMTHVLPFPDTVPTLADPHLRLRELAEDDLPGWFQRATDAESADLAGDPIPQSIDEGLALLARNRERFRARTAIRWAIVPAGSETSVGSVGLAITASDRGIAELGIVIARAWWGRGLGTAAVRLVTQYGFHALGLTAIHAEMLQRNPASVRMFEKSGFRRRHAPPDAPQSDDPAEACFFYELRRHAGSAP